MTTRALLLLALTLAAPAVALTPIPECAPSDGPEAAFYAYSVGWHGAGFVLYGVTEKESETQQMLLEDCAGDRVLVMTAPHQGSEDYQAAADADQALWAVLYKALESKQLYTFGQIQAMAGKVGAKTALGRMTYESCACDRYGQSE